ncbi:MAG: hypothetical protein RMJ55_11405 [Roseiflexaceae bacterium]|nr:hypothetical protein [Roseiflexus sp.]MDW8214155.1 hypothetical protein [Roseiflexaceae bacterium]
MELTTITQVAPGRLIGLAPDGDLRLVWDYTTIRIPLFDLPHLAALLDLWLLEEEPPQLRRGYYRLTHSPEGGYQLWLHNAGLWLSHQDIHTLTTLVNTVVEELCRPICRQPKAPFGLGYRKLIASPRKGHNQN